jgi:hypothetical protein
MKGDTLDSTGPTLLEALKLDLPSDEVWEDGSEVPELESVLRGGDDDYRYRDGPGGAHEHFAVFY